MNEVPDGIDDEIELLDLGDATLETRQFSPWAMWFDSLYLYGERDL